MATGASNAQLAVILIDARKGVLVQTKRHSFICSLLGVRHVVVAVNKIDLVDYNQEVFDRIVADYTSSPRSSDYQRGAGAALRALWRQCGRALAQDALVQRPGAAGLS